LSGAININSSLSYFVVHDDNSFEYLLILKIQFKEFDVMRQAKIIFHPGVEPLFLMKNIFRTLDLSSNLDRNGTFMNSVADDILDKVKDMYVINIKVENKVFKWYYTSDNLTRAIETFCSNVTNCSFSKIYNESIQMHSSMKLDYELIKYQNFLRMGIWLDYPSTNITVVRYPYYGFYNYLFIKNQISVNDICNYYKRIIWPHMSSTLGYDINDKYIDEDKLELAYDYSSSSGLDTIDICSTDEIDHHYQISSSSSSSSS
jgi:hypothetical protein